MTKKVFPGQEENEKIIKAFFRHPFILIKNEFIPILLFIASIATMTFFFYLYPPFVFLGSFIVFILSITWGFYSYYTWIKDKYVITDHRIIDIEQVTLFTRSQKEAPLARIQDVSSEIKSFWGALFRFGSVHVQTASDTSLTLDDVPNPEKIQSIIFNLIKEAKKEEDEDKGIIKKMIEMLRGMGAKEEDIMKELEKKSGLNEEKENSIENKES